MGVIEQEISKLSDGQKKAVFHENGDAVCIAGPGSGKTRVIAMRSMLLLKKYAGMATTAGHGVVVTMSFNKQAALEMAERSKNFAASFFGDNFQQYLNLTHFSTIHSYCYSIIKEYCNRCHLKVPEIADGNRQEEILKTVYERITKSKNCSIEEIRKIKLYVIEMDFVDGEKTDHIISSVRKEYQKFKNENNIIDFEDMQKLACKYLKENEEFRKNIKEKYMFVQIDEAQDLSPLQAEISGLISNKGIFYVADDDQSIYGFRGAAPDVIKKISYGSVSLYLLGNNYRSNSEITSLASKFICQNKKRFDKKIVSFRGNGGNVLIEVFRDYISQARFIAKLILKEKKKGNSIAVLYRNNASMLLPIACLYYESKRIGIDVKPKVMGEYTPLSKFTVIKDLSGLIGSDNKIRQLDFLKKERIADKILFSCEISGKRKFFTSVVLEIIELVCSKSQNGINLYDQIVKIDKFAENTGADADVTFSTIHSSKGLEFDTVVIVDNVEGEFPFGKCSDEKELFEERRLMYVAMTRAKNRLYITYPCWINDQELSASRFVDELLNS